MIPVVQLRTVDQDNGLYKLLMPSPTATVREPANAIRNGNDLRQQREGEEEDAGTTTSSVLSVQNDILNDVGTLYVTIRNVTSSFNLKSRLNLRYLALNGYNVEYKREHGKLLMKIRKPMTTACIWSNGKIVCVGSASEVDAKIAAKRIARIIQKLGHHKVQFCSYKVCHVLGSCILPFPIKTIPFSMKYRPEVPYEPGFNSGVTYKIQKFKATLIVFNTGNITVSAPSEALVKQAIEHIYPLVLPFAQDNMNERHMEIITQQQNNVQEPNAEELFKSPEESLLINRHSIGELLKNGQLDLDSFLQSLV